MEKLINCLSTEIMVDSSLSWPHSCASLINRETRAPLDAMACGVVTDAFWLLSEEEAIAVAVIEVDKTEGSVDTENMGEADFRLT